LTRWENQIKESDTPESKRKTGPLVTHGSQARRYCLTTQKKIGKLPEKATHLVQPSRAMNFRNCRTKEVQNDRSLFNQPRSEKLG
jgi:hypothetical protein